MLATPFRSVVGTINYHPAAIPYPDYTNDPSLEQLVVDNDA